MYDADNVVSLCDNANTNNYITGHEGILWELG